MVSFFGGGGLTWFAVVVSGVAVGLGLIIYAILTKRG